MDKTYRTADFLFQQDFAPGHSAKTTVNWFADCSITVLYWAANVPDQCANVLLPEEGD